MKHPNRRLNSLLVVNAVTLIIMLFTNSLANILPINGVTTGQVSAAYQNLFTPAGFTFGIWGLIYLLLLAQFIYLLVARIKGSDNKILTQVGGILSIIHITNASWLLVWHHQRPGFSWLLIVVLLVLLWLANEKLRRTVTGTSSYLFGKLPIRVYLGWIVVATFANTAVLLTKWDVPGEIYWAPFFALLVVGVAVLFVVYRKDLAVPITITWALAGIYYGNLARQDEGNEVMRWFAMAGMGIVLLSILFILIRKVTSSSA